ncbi:hypothetical protein [Nakamurella endophytica]|uniref:Uncharacterized protein n=1 Tax=Nakamurella endophytica TaxID=1748367 RepID=A0A917WFD2_9ACTN|nr:hypothetical protein [Nakamurella endophytica]GGL98529.1 hypothetical protein GCM10011594_18030 [Nakamurella endophytica]
MPRPGSDRNRPADEGRHGGPPLLLQPPFVLAWIATLAVLVAAYFAHHRVPHLHGRHITNLFLFELLTGWGAYVAVLIWPWWTQWRRRSRPPASEPASLRIVIVAEVVTVVAVAVALGWLAGVHGNP